MLPEDSPRSKQHKDAQIYDGSHKIRSDEDQGEHNIVGLYTTLPTKTLPEIPIGDETFDFSSIIGPTDPEEEKVKKRASNVLRLTQENQKLMAELKAMQDRLESLERAQKRRKEQLSNNE